MIVYLKNTNHMSRTNTEVRNALMSTVSKLYEGLFPAHDILLRERVQRKLGSRFLSVERDNDSEVDPVIRRNLEDYYEEANGINLIEFSRSPNFFPGKVDLYYTLEEVTRIARKSPYTSLEEFYQYVKTRPDADRFGCSAFYGGMEGYVKKGGNPYFLGIEKLERLREKVFSDLDDVIKEGKEGGYCLGYVRTRMKEIVDPYSPDSEIYDKSLYKGIKGGPIGCSSKHIRISYVYERKITLKEILPLYASDEKFIEFCKKFNPKNTYEIDNFSRNPEMEEFHKKYGIPARQFVFSIYPSEVIDIVFPDSRRASKYHITYEEGLIMKSQIESGKSMTKIAKERGIPAPRLCKKLQALGIDFIKQNQKIEICLKTLKMMCIAGKSGSEMANHFGVSTPIIWDRIEKNGFRKLFPINEEIPVEKITKLLEEGESMSSIGRILGIKNTMVKKILERNEIKFKYKSSIIEDQNKEEILNMLRKGESISEVSRRFGLNRRNVSNFMRENGISLEPQFKKINSEDEKKIFKLLKEGKKYSEISKELNFHPKHISKLDKK